ncbi:MAG: hypothetical protein HFG74_09415 [Hungatella sp.]|nr:hypothetical protein [Hungatella sp.]
MENDNRQNMEDIAGRLRSVFLETVESLELDRLNETVKNTVGSALDEARLQMEQCREKMEDIKWRRQTVWSDEECVRKPLEIRVNRKGRVSGILFTVFGSIGAGIFGLTALAPLAVVIASPNNLLGWWIFGVCGVIAAGFGGMLAKGISQNGRLHRLKQYVEELRRRDRPYCGIEDLSRSCARRPGFVKKDLRRIIRLGMLPDARMDEKEQWLLLNEETCRQYELYLKSLEQKERTKNLHDREDRSRRQEEASGGEDRGTGLETPVEKAIRQGEEYIAAVDRLRDCLNGEDVREFREKLVHLDAVLESLFDTLRKHPEQLSELEKFMDYYLPTTVKLVSTYHEFSMVEFPGDNIREAKKEIEKTMDTINQAFEKLLDDMYEDAAFDVMTDASVLQTLLSREGMT